MPLQAVSECLRRRYAGIVHSCLLTTQYLLPLPLYTESIMAVLYKILSADTHVFMSATVMKISA